MNKEVTGTLYAIFRVGEKKYKDIRQIKGYENHMERQIETLNADTNIQNIRLKGSKNIVGDVKEYIKDVALRKNSVLARDLLLTASPSFFKGLTDEQKYQWVNINLKWLEENFGNNCIYATLHRDETTWHISSLIVPRFYDEKKQRYVLANSRYFDGIAKLSKWQDIYSEAMKKGFEELNRGVKFSKAKHVKIRQYYTLINSQLNEKDLNSVLARAKNSTLLEQQIRTLRDTLSSYQSIKNEKDKSEKVNSVLVENIGELKKDKDIYKETIRALSEIYKIPQGAISKIVDAVQSKLTQDNDKSKGRSLEK